VPDAASVDCGDRDLWIVRRTGDLSHVSFDGSSDPGPDLHDVVALRHVIHDGVCALRRDGHVTCWGWLDFSDKKPSITISGIDTAVALECSPLTCCAVLRDGGVRCFGRADKELGVDGALARTPPIAMGQARSVAIGRRSACAVDAAGVRSCWGDASHFPPVTGATSRLVRVDDELCSLDESGRLRCPRPLPADLGEGIVDVIDGNRHTCVVRRDGTVGCWGSNEYGELGDGIPLVRPGPARVAGVDDVVELNVAHTNVCARTKNGMTWCWGEGDGRPTRRDVVGPMVPTQYAAGCTVRQGKVHCVQSNLFGTEWHVVISEPPGGPKDLRSAAIDRAPNIYMLDGAGAVSAWFSMNNNGMAERVLPMSAPSKVHGLTPTALGACALLDGGRVACFEDERHDNDEKFLTKAPASRVFRGVAGIAGAVQLAGGSAQACARTNDGRVLCWELRGVRPPREVEAARGAIDIASNEGEVCAVVQEGMLCWMLDGAPVRVAGLPPIVRVGTGRESRCALDRAGHVWCWGVDAYGELGAGRRRAVTDHVINVAGVGP
jgi:hypothetical protein